MCAVFLKQMSCSILLISSYRSYFLGLCPTFGIFRPTFGIFSTFWHFSYFSGIFYEIKVFETADFLQKN